MITAVNMINFWEQWPQGSLNESGNINSTAFWGIFHSFSLYCHHFTLEYKRHAFRDRKARFNIRSSVGRDSQPNRDCLVKMFHFFFNVVRNLSCVEIHLAICFMSQQSLFHLEVLHLHPSAMTKRSNVVS